MSSPSQIPTLVRLLNRERELVGDLDEAEAAVVEKGRMAEAVDAAEKRVFKVEKEKAVLRRQLLQLDAEVEANREEQRLKIEQIRKKYANVELKPYEVDFVELELKRKIGAGSNGEARAASSRHPPPLSPLDRISPPCFFARIRCTSAPSAARRAPSSACPASRSTRRRSTT